MAEEHNNFEITFHERKDFNFKGVELTTCLIIDEAYGHCITHILEDRKMSQEH